MTEPTPERQHGAKIGIFRRIAVMRYMRPMEANRPEMIAPSCHALLGWALLLMCAAVVVLLIA